MNYYDVVELHKRGKVSDVVMSYCLSKALNDDNERVRLEAIMHPKATSENTALALNDSCSLVRYATIKYRKVTSEQLDKATDDVDCLVRHEANFIKSKNK